MNNNTPTYPKGDLRRMLAVIAAIDSTTGATLVQIAEKTGVDKKTVTGLIKQASEQAGVTVSKVGAVYRIVEWGPVIKQKGAKMALTGALNAPNMNTSNNATPPGGKTMFTQQNTEGFTDQQLELMNKALAALIEDGIDEKSASDIVNNNWMPEDNTVESLIKR